MTEYGFVKHLDMDFDAAVELIMAQLQNEGFGIVMMLDMQRLFAEKLGLDFHKYLILGACDPVNACKALLAEENIGLMLPCNVIVYESEGGTAVGIIRPTAAMQMIENLDLHRIAKDVERRLKNVIDALPPVGAAPERGRPRGRGRASGY